MGILNIPGLLIVKSPVIQRSVQREHRTTNLLPLQLVLGPFLPSRIGVNKVLTYSRHYMDGPVPAAPLLYQRERGWNWTHEHYGPTYPLFNLEILSVQRQTLQTVTWFSYGPLILRCCSRNCYAKHKEQALATNTRTIPLIFGYATWKTHSSFFSDILTDRTRTRGYQGDRVKW